MECCHLNLFAGQPRWYFCPYHCCQARSYYRTNYGLSRTKGHHVPAGFPGTYTRVVMDPPWENASVKRSGRYAQLPDRQLLRLPIPRLLHPVSVCLRRWYVNAQMCVSACCLIIIVQNLGQMVVSEALQYCTCTLQQLLLRDLPVALLQYTSGCCLLRKLAG